MSELIPFAEVTHLFTDFEHTAWRLESRQGYGSDRATERYQRFVSGGPVEDDPAHPWLANIREQTRQGKRIERVRVVDDPPTVGQRFLIASGLGNVAAGEDIRNLYRSDAQRLALPNDDFWLFDSRTLVRLVFDDDDRTLGVEVTEEPAAVVRACQVRDVAWHFAIRTTEFGARVASTV